MCAEREELYDINLNLTTFNHLVGRCFHESTVSFRLLHVLNLP